MEYEIQQDDAAENPRAEFDHLGTILYTSHRYLLGDRKTEVGEIHQVERDGNNIVLPVYAYIHSGVTLSTNSFGCPWDSGQCGIIYATKEDALKWFGKDEMTPELGKLVEETLKKEVEEFSLYLSGGVLAWVVRDSAGDILESVGGYYDRECAEADAKAALEGYLHKRGRKNEIEVTCLGEPEGAA